MQHTASINSAFKYKHIQFQTPKLIHPNQIGLFTKALLIQTHPIPKTIQTHLLFKSKHIQLSPLRSPNNPLRSPHSQNISFSNHNFKYKIQNTFNFKSNSYFPFPIINFHNTFNIQTFPNHNFKHIQLSNPIQLSPFRSSHSQYIQHTTQNLTNIKQNLTNIKQNLTNFNENSHRSHNNPLRSPFDTYKTHKSQQTIENPCRRNRD